MGEVLIVVALVLATGAGDKSAPSTSVSAIIPHLALLPFPSLVQLYIGANMPHLHTYAGAGVTIWPNISTFTEIVGILLITARHPPLPAPPAQARGS